MTNLILQATQDAIIDFLKEIKGTDEAIKEIETIYDNLKSSVSVAGRYGTGPEVVSGLVKDRFILALKAAYDVKEDGPVDPIKPIREEGQADIGLKEDGAVVEPEKPIV